MSKIPIIRKLSTIFCHNLNILYISRYLKLFHDIYGVNFGISKILKTWDLLCTFYKTRILLKVTPRYCQVLCFHRVFHRFYAQNGVLLFYLTSASLRYANTEVLKDYNKNLVFRFKAVNKKAVKEELYKK